MIRETYLAQIEWLTMLLESWNSQIDNIAAREAKLAEAGMPNDDEATAAKFRLVQKCDALIERLQELHEEYGG